MIRYLENSIENMRDIGGYKNSLGNTLKTGKLIRSNLPISLSNDDIYFIKKLEIKTIIDLRSFDEIEAKKSVFEDNKDFKVYHIGINLGKDIPKTENQVPKSYMQILTLYEKIKNIFEILNNNDKVLYFCNAGKDRTGVITALIHKLLDVKKEDIIEDYMATKEFMKETLNIYANSNNEVLNVITPKRIYIETFLKEFEEKYTNIEKYLELIGIDKYIIKNIKKKYINT